MTDNFEELLGDENPAAAKRAVKMFISAVCLSDPELTLTAALDLASELCLREMLVARATHSEQVEFIEALEEGETEPEVEPHVPTESEAMVTLRHNAIITEWKQRIALARSISLSSGGPCSWDNYRQACAKHGMSPGESVDQLLARLAPYHRAAEAAYLARRKS